MSLKRNILANYLSQIYAAVIGVVMLPFYIQYMGAEAYGLVGFFALLQAWFLHLDMGLMPSVIRATIRFRGGDGDALGLRRLLWSLEGVAICVASLVGLGLILGADSIAGHWLKAEHLSRDEVANAIRLMALTIALKWTSEFYRGVISGFERWVWFSVFSAVIATIRFVMVIPFFIWVSSSVETFFLFQLCVTALEIAFLTRKTYALLPAVTIGAARWNWKPLRNILGFSAAMALTGAMWASVLQTDKLLVSGMLPLAEYGWFSLAVLAGSGVLLLVAPIVTALVPRLTAVHALGDVASLLELYRKGTQWVGILAWSSGGVLASQAERLIWIWTGDAQLAAHTNLTLSLYALGNGVMALSAFPYYLQFAKGQLRLHLLGTILLALVLVPCLIWAVSRYGAAGAGWTWLGSHILFFTLWIPVVHRRHATGLHIDWLLHDVAPIVLLALTAAWASRWLPWPEQRVLACLQLLMVSAGVLMISSIGSSWLRARIAHSWRQFMRQDGTS
ncbi:MAG: oligosaccharide flippase family protein [Betaproteobacteria bacterium]|nr:oligosaccharide flippase family protein [Betaproteobacteria bacterium]